MQGNFHKFSADYEDAPPQASQSCKNLLNKSLLGNYQTDGQTDRQTVIEEGMHIIRGNGTSSYASSNCQLKLIQKLRH